MPAKWIRGFVFLAAFYLVVTQAIALVSILARPYPSNPWESATTVEAARRANGHAVYEDPQVGHATHLYGFLFTDVIALLFKMMGASNQVGRVISLLAAMGLGVLALRTTLTRSSPALIALGVGLFLAINGQTHNYFVASRPDLLALFLAAVACVLLYRGFAAKRYFPLLLGTAVLIAATLVKQVAAQYAAIPFLAVWFFTRGRSLPFLALYAFGPLAGVAGAFALLRVWQPWAYFYMVEVLGSHPILPAVLFERGLHLVLTSCLLWFALVLWWRSRPRHTRFSPRLVWIAVGIPVTLLSSLLATAKVGGAENALLPIYLQITILCLYLLNHLQFGRRANVWTVVLTFAAVAQGVAYRPVLNRGYFSIPDPRMTDYPEMIRELKDLSGTVLCPEDPTLILFARDKYERNIFSYADLQVKWHFPLNLERDIRQANYVVDVLDWWGDLYINPRELERLGYRKIRDNASYALWEQGYSSGYAQLNNIDNRSHYW